MRTNQQPFFFVLIVSEVSQSSDSSEGDCEWDGSFDQDEEEILKYYFYRGFSYQEILCFLSDRHQCQISYSTLLRKLKKYRLFRCGVTKQESFSDTFLKVQGRMSGASPLTDLEQLLWECGVLPFPECAKLHDTQVLSKDH